MKKKKTKCINSISRSICFYRIIVSILYIYVCIYTYILYACVHGILGKKNGAVKRGELKQKG